ncbi:MAG: hypothetical protein B6I26_08695 [Desulfobacteraceae bacterium 4572_130]|nr:MAG: hypothetical protein B6I26_08695 [Desulfobacteraceae bacterium 4572_130]
MLNTKFSNKKILLMITFIFFVFIIFVPFFISWIIDTDYIKKKIGQIVSEKTNNQITYSKIDFIFFPKPHLKIDEIVIKGQNFKIDTALIYPDILSLIKGKIKTDKVCINNPTASILSIILKKKTLDINYKNKKKEVILSLPQIDFSLFEPFLTSQKKILILINNLKSNIFHRANASILILPKQKEITGTVEVENIKIKNSLHTKFSFAKEIKAFYTSNIKTIFSYKNSNEFTADITALSPLIVFKNQKKISSKNSNTVVFITNNKIKVSLRPCTLDFPLTNIITNFNYDKKKGANLTFLGENINIEQIKKAGINVFLKNQICKKIFQILPLGKATKLSVAFNSTEMKKLFNEKNMIIHGTVENAMVNIPQTRLIVKEISASAIVKKGMLNINVKKGIIQNSIIEKGNFSIDLLHSENPFNGKFFINADLKNLSSVLQELLPKTILANELKLCKKIKGRAKGTLVLKKQKKNIFVQVDVNDIKFKGEYSRIQEEISILNGKFSYKDDEINIANINGLIGKNKFSNLTAYFSLKKDYPFEIKSDDIRLNIHKFFPYLLLFKKTKEIFSPLESGSGELFLDSLYIKGAGNNPKKWQYNGKGFFKDMNLSSNSSKNQISNTSFKFNISSNFLSISELNSVIADTSFLSSKFKKPYFNEIKVPFTISKTKFKTKNKNTDFQGKFVLNNSVELFLNINKLGKSYFLNKIKIKDQSISDAIISYNNDELCLKFNGKINIKTIIKILKQNSIFRKKLIALTDNKKVLIKSGNKSDIIVLADSINFDSIMQKKITRNLDKIMNKTLVNHKSLTSSPLIINFNTKTLKYKKKEFTPFKAKIFLNKNKTSIIIKKAELCAINSSGSIKKTNNEINFKLKFNGKKKDLNTTLSCLLNKQAFADGNYSIKGNIYTKGNLNSINKNFKGNIDFYSTNGRIYKLTLLSRILSVINVSKIFKGKLPNFEQNGFAYNSMAIEATIEKSRIFINSAIINGIDMNLSFTGWIDPLKKNLNLTCLISPLKTIDIVIDKIPFINTILDGHLVSIPVKATGKINNPMVIILHPGAIGDGIVNTMKRILETSYDLLKKIPH